MSQKRLNGYDAPPPGTRERRSVCRYSVVQDSAWIGWWEGQTYQTTAAKIIDISLRGALLHVDTLPPKEHAVWFCPPGITANDEWIEVKTINLRKRLFGAREMRVAFRKVFPYEIFKAVVYGPDAIRTVEQPAWVPEDATDRDWW
jgi:hypothetical protein